MCHTKIKVLEQQDNDNSLMYILVLQTFKNKLYTYNISLI